MAMRSLELLVRFLKGGTETDVSNTGTDQLPSAIHNSSGTRIDPATAGNQSTANAALAAIQTALEAIDDWDESDRAAVNLIASQAGITGGAGAVAANSPRVTLASDDPAVAALEVIDDWDESDRAKVNLIPGQAGVTAGSGAVAANTQRVTLASDDPAVAALQATATPFFDEDGDNTEQTMKASAGSLTSLHVSNPNVTEAFVQLFDEAGSVTVGTTTPVWVLRVPASSSVNAPITLPMAFANSIKYACTTTATGSTDPSTGLFISAGYQ